MTSGIRIAGQQIGGPTSHHPHTLQARPPFSLSTVQARTLLACLLFSTPRRNDCHSPIERLGLQIAALDAWVGTLSWIRADRQQAPHFCV
jgi:hypothetical protein